MSGMWRARGGMGPTRRVPRDAAVAQAMASLDWRGEVVWATSFWRRLTGLVAMDPIGESGGARIVVFPRCSSVHTCWMRLALDVAFLDAEGHVLVVKEGVPPWRMLSVPGAASVMERASPVARGGVLCGGITKSPSNEGLYQAMVAREGVEPPTRGFSVLCSTN